MAVDQHGDDRIEIRGLELLLFCGVLAEEQARRQPFRFDIDLHIDLVAAGTSDDLADTINYGHVIDRLSETLTAERFQLLERLATRVIELVLAETAADGVTVTVHKLRPPVVANLESTGVRLHRRRVDG